LVNLDPQSKVYLENFKKLPELQTMEPQTIRELLAKSPPVEVELAPLTKVEDRMIPVDHKTEIKIRIYTPEGQGPFPLFVYYHGGGWVLGDIQTCDVSCSKLANRTGRVVVSVDYRLAPEYKFPIPLQDCYAALKWVHENASLLNANASNIVVGGDSAGGNLATVVSIMSRDKAGPAIEAQVLFYPITSLSYDTKSYHEFEKGYGLSRDLMIWTGNHYINNIQDSRNKYVSPLLADDLSRLPPAFIITAENDVLRDEGLAYAERLKKAGVLVEVVCELGMVHGYFTLNAIFPDRIKDSILKISKFLAANSSLK